MSTAGTGTLRFIKPPYVELAAGLTAGSGHRFDGPRSGEQTTLTLWFMMHGDMGGLYDFRVHLPTNDPTWGDRTRTVLSDWVTSPR